MTELTALPALMAPAGYLARNPMLLSTTRHDRCSLGDTRVTAWPDAPDRPVRPTRCT